MGRCPGTAPWNSSGLGVTPGTAKVQTGITSSLVARMGQVRCPWASTESVDADRVVVRRNPITYVKVMEA